MEGSAISNFSAMWGSDGQWGCLLFISSLLLKIKFCGMNEYMDEHSVG